MYDFIVPWRCYSLFLHFAHFWLIRQQGVVNAYQHFGTTYRCHRQGYKIGSTGYPETSVRNYHSSLRNNSSAVLNIAITCPMLIISDHKEYPDARDILKIYRCPRLRNRERFGEHICLHRQIKRGEEEPTLVGPLEATVLCHWTSNWIYPECTCLPLSA